MVHSLLCLISFTLPSHHLWHVRKPSSSLVLSCSCDSCSIHPDSKARNLGVIQLRPSPLSHLFPQPHQEVLELLSLLYLWVHPSLYFQGCWLNRGFIYLFLSSPNWSSCLPPGSFNLLISQPPVWTSKTEILFYHLLTSLASHGFLA